MIDSFLWIIGLIIASAFFSVSEIALAASRPIKLNQLIEAGELNAHKVIALKEQPGHYFTVVQIGLNAVAILGGIMGESALTPYLSEILQRWLTEPTLGTVSFTLSFVVVTSLFILCADLIPKRLAMMAPEKTAVHIIGPMLFFVSLFKPLVFIFNGLADLLFRLFKIPTMHKEVITPDDIFAVMSAGAEAGVLREQEHYLIENVFELDSKTVPSTMTLRDNIIYFDCSETESEIKQKIAEHPHSKFLVCDGTIDKVLGYVDSKDILLRVLHQKPISLTDEKLIQTPLIIPDTLTLTEALAGFKGSREDFAVILNEYALVVGIVTLNDIMNTLMGDLVNHDQEEQIIRRDENSWLIDGLTPIDDVMSMLEIESFPEHENYETIAGFMMYMLRKIPKRTDAVSYAGYKFEVVDIDSYKVDQLLVTRIAIHDKAESTDTAPKDTN